MEVAKHVVSRHRLVEAFLVKIMGVPWDEVHEEAEAFEMGVTPALEARMLEMIGEARTCPHGHPIGDYPREPGVPLTAASTGSVVRILRFENEDHDLLRMFRRAGVEPMTSYTIVAFGEDLAKLEGPEGPSELPLYAARTISVAVERTGDGSPAEQDPEPGHRLPARRDPLEPVAPPRALRKSCSAMVDGGDVDGSLAAARWG